MAWTDFFIKRPVFSLSLATLFIFAGLFGYAYLPLRLFPKIDVPMITIAINYPGASSSTMEGFITNTIENSLTGVNDVNYITSSSRQGHVDITILMNAGANVDTSLADVMQKIASVRSQLPQGIDEPVITKADADDNPILLLAFTSNTLSRAQISDYLNRALKPQLEAINGVGSAEVLGGEYAMRLWLDPTAMAAYHLTMNDVMQSLHQQSVQSTAGTLDGQTEQNVTLNSDLNTVGEFNNIVIKQAGNAAVHLSDVGEAQLGNETYKINAFYNGQAAVMIFVKPQTGANPLSVVSDIEKMLPAIQQQLPSSVKCNIVVNAATYIKASIKEVIKTMAEAIIIVALVIFLFLGNFRAVLVPLVTIPLSLIGICFFLMILGYSINLLTLLAMVIAIGLVVDDAIVVMENIHRYIEQGNSPLVSALIATKEIAFSIIAMTLTLAAIFAPIAFSSGITGKLFSEFAWTLAGSVLISGVIALTLSPMMCAKIMSNVQNESPLTHHIEAVFSKIKQKYLCYLDQAFQHKKLILAFWAVSLVGCLYFYASTPKELSPKEDEGFLQVIANVPDSMDAQALAKNSQQLNQIYQSMPEVASSIYINGIPDAHQVLSFVRLTPWEQRSLSSTQIQPLLQEKLNRIPGLQSVAIVPSVLPGTQGLPVQFVIKTVGDYQSLYQASEKLMLAARKSGLFLFVNDDLNYDQPVLKINIDREAATAIGVSIDDITQTLAGALNENKAQYFNLSGRSYEVIPQLYQANRLNPDQLNELHVAAKNGTLVPLSSVVSMKTVTEPAALNQFQKFNSVTISGVIAPNHTLSEGLQFLQATAQHTLPVAMHTDYAGNSRQFIQEGNRMLWLFLSAFIVIFILLAMQFESFKDPMIILLGSLPMTLMAAMLPLKFGFSTINIYTQIGLLTLAGLVSKHGILLTKFANMAQQRGCSKTQAMREAAAIRFRPILMTTLAIVFGVLPLVFASGAGATSRFDIGIVIAVGMSLGTLFTLFVIPILYQYFSDHHSS